MHRTRCSQLARTIREVASAGFRRSHFIDTQRRTERIAGSRSRATSSGVPRRERRSRARKQHLPRPFAALDPRTAWFWQDTDLAVAQILFRRSVVVDVGNSIHLLGPFEFHGQQHTRRNRPQLGPRTFQRSSRSDDQHNRPLGIGGSSTHDGTMQRRTLSVHRRN